MFWIRTCFNVAKVTTRTNDDTIDLLSDRKFWEFTFDEMIAYDAPAIIDYIMQTTKQGKLLGFPQIYFWLININDLALRKASNFSFKSC